MVTARSQGLFLLLALLTACPGYNPDFIDCKVKCSKTNTCPANQECKLGLCRPLNAATSCDCTSGAQRPCGGGKGVCNPGVQTCTNFGSWGQCVGDGKPSAEICDAKDNDCNGTVDDNVGDAPFCALTRGVCVGSVQKCVDGSYSGACEDSDYGSSYEKVELRCDSLDNDCNGVVDATQPTTLIADVSDFVLAEYDGGFSLVGIKEPLSGGEYQVVLLRLDAALVKRDPLPVPVSPPGLTTPLMLAARATANGTTFVAWAAQEVDAGVNLSSIDPNGIVSQFPSYLKSEKAGELSLGANASKVLVSWPAHATNFVRLVTWDLGDAGIATKDYYRTADGGFNPEYEFYSSRLSPSGKVIGIRGYDNDAGVSINWTAELQGTKTSTYSLGSRYQFVEVGNQVQSGWSYSYAAFFIFIEARSGFEFKSDVFSTASAASLRYQADLNIGNGSIGRGQNSAVVVWTERNVTAIIASPFGNGSQARQRLLVTDGGYFGSVQLAHPGGSGQLIGIVWRDTLSGPGNVSGMMICQP